MKRLLFVLFAAAALVQLTLAAQDARPGAPPEIDALKRLTFRNIGPANQAGRVSVIVGVPGNPDTFYVSGANGGIFKTVNGGTTWKALFDNQNVLSIGAIAVAPSNPNIIYVGTGEENPRNNASFGDGIYRSNDGGETGRTSASRTPTASRASASTPQSRRRLRLRDGARVGTERGARRLQDDRRRQDWKRHAVRRRADRLLRHRRRSGQLQHRSTPACTRYRR